MKKFMIVLAVLFALTVVSCGPDTWIAPDGLGATYLKNGTQVSVTWMAVEGALWYEVAYRRDYESVTTAHTINKNKVTTTAYLWNISNAEEYNSETLFFKVRAWKNSYIPWSAEFALATYQD